MEHEEVGAASLHGDEVGYLAVGVACHVLKRGHACGFLVETRQRHDGEQLVYGPVVGQRLEEGEVAEVLVRQHFGDFFQFLGCVFYFIGHVVHIAGNRPEKPFDLCSCAQIDKSEAEEVERFFPYL